MKTMTMYVDAGPEDATILIQIHSSINGDELRFPDLVNLIGGIIGASYTDRREVIVHGGKNWREYLADAIAQTTGAGTTVKAV